MAAAIDTFRASLADPAPPEGLSPSLSALWHAGRGAWQTAHGVVQDEGDAESAWVHAYLHRQEGDVSNAAYWYRRAGKPVATGTIEAEWAEIVSALLAHSRSSTER